MSFEETEKLVIHWGYNRNLCNSSAPLRQCNKLQEELNELKQAILKKDLVETCDAIGDMIVVLTIIAHSLNTDITTCYKLAYSEIKDRTGKTVDGIFVKD